MSSKMKDGLILNILRQLNDSEDDNEKAYLNAKFIALMNESNVMYEVEDDG